MNNRRTTARAFTLIELLVVLTLLGLLAGMTVVRLDGLSGQARLRAAVSQHASVIKLAQTQAKASGEPRLMEYATAKLTLRKPKKTAANWEWDEGMDFDLPAGVTLRCIIRPGNNTLLNEQSMRVPPDGRIEAHGVIFAAQQQVLAALYSTFEEPKVRFYEKDRQVSTWMTFVQLFEARHEKP